MFYSKMPPMSLSDPTFIVWNHFFVKWFQWIFNFDRSGYWAKSSKAFYAHSWKRNAVRCPVYGSFRQAWVTEGANPDMRLHDTQHNDI